MARFPAVSTTQPLTLADLQRANKILEANQAKPHGGHLDLFIMDDPVETDEMSGDDWWKKYTNQEDAMEKKYYDGNGSFKDEPTHRGIHFTRGLQLWLADETDGVKCKFAISGRTIKIAGSSLDDHVPIYNIDLNDVASEDEFRKAVILALDEINKTVIT